jgi:hypothetical protein
MAESKNNNGAVVEISSKHGCSTTETFTKKGAESNRSKTPTPPNKKPNKGE